MYHCAMLVSHWLSFICSLVILLLITNYTDWHTSLLFVFWPTCFYHHQFLSKDPDLACIGKSWQACQHRLAVRVMWGTKQHEENRKQLMPLTPKNCWYTGEEDFGIGNELHMCCHETLGGWVDTDTHMDTKHPLVFLYRHKRLTLIETCLTVHVNLKLFHVSVQRYLEEAGWQRAGAYILATICQHRKNLTYTLSLALFPIQTAHQLSGLTLVSLVPIYQLRWKWKRTRCKCRHSTVQCTVDIQVWSLSGQRRSLIRRGVLRITPSVNINNTTLLFVSLWQSGTLQLSRDLKGHSTQT